MESTLRTPSRRGWFRPMLLVCVASSWLWGGCERQPEQPTGLDPDEQRLVSEVLDLIEIKIERARDPQKAEEMREALPELYTREELDAMIDHLSIHPRRAQLVMQAIKDSLEARRSRIFPPHEVPPEKPASPKIPGED